MSSSGGTSGGADNAAGGNPASSASSSGAAGGSGGSASKGSAATPQISTTERVTKSKNNTLNFYRMFYKMSFHEQLLYSWILLHKIILFLTSHNSNSYSLSSMTDIYFKVS